MVVSTTTIYIFVMRETSQEDIAQLTVPIQVKSITIQITSSGKVQPIRNVNISPKNVGILTRLYVEQGNKVKAGQILACMDNADIQVEVDQARADWEQAQAKLAEARAGNRPQEIAKAQAQVDSAKAKAVYT
ncbi:MAG: biotin/lipoyl-binding protein [Nostoc sp.]|uniref:biotin/lipoyl-binding protein n=1 Tax=Nostoc sp. TaxID=1180 RepID=UPI002FF8A51C